MLAQQLEAENRILIASLRIKTVVSLGLYIESVVFLCLHVELVVFFGLYIESVVFFGLYIVSARFSRQVADTRRSGLVGARAPAVVPAERHDRGLRRRDEAAAHLHGARNAGREEHAEAREQPLHGRGPHGEGFRLLS